MAEVTKELVESAIKGYVEPHLGRDLVTAGVVKGIAIEGDQVKVKVVLGFPAKGIQQSLAEAVKERVMAVPGVAMAQVDLTWEIKAHSVQKSLKPIDNVKNIIAVASGKGGVASPPPRSTWRLRCLPRGPRSASSTPTSMARPSRACSASPASPSRSTARAWSR